MPNVLLKKFIIISKVLKSYRGLIYSFFMDINRIIVLYAFKYLLTFIVKMTYIYHIYMNIYIHNIRQPSGITHQRVSPTQEPKGEASHVGLAQGEALAIS